MVIVPGPGGLVFAGGPYGTAAVGADGAVLWQDGYGMDATGAIAVDADGVAYYGFEGGSPAHRLVARRPDGPSSGAATFPDASTPSR